MLVHKAATDGVVHQVSVLLPPSLFRKRGLVKVSIKSNLLESSDRCVDAREGSAFIHVLPESSLYLSYDPGIHSVRDFWRMLPQNVTISLPSGTLTPEIFKAAWSMMSMLEKSGKTTKLVHFPELGHITIASKTMLHDQIKTNLVSKGKVADFAKIHYPGLNKDANISLVSYKNHHLLAINEPFDTSPFYLLNDQWNTLAAGQHYRLFPLAYTSYLSKMRLPEASVGQQYSIPVEKIGINTKVQKMFRSTSWSTTVGPYDLPPDSYMSQLKLNVISPISDKRDRDYELYVYINNILLRSMRMKNTGTMQSFDIQLPKDYQIQFNQLSIVAEHDIEQGDCRGLSPTDPFQILPSSKVILSKQSSAPNNFFDLTYYFANGFDTYIEKDYLKDADSLLHLMTRVSVDYPLLADMNRVRFVDGGSTLTPSRPFWAIGDFDLSNITAPMRFDNGRVNVVDNANNTIMDIDQLAKVTTMQIARSGDVSGLLIHPDHQHNFAFPEALHLQRDDIAFLDNNGIILSLDSSKQTQIRVFYPDISTWFDVFDAYRFWFFALGWFLLSFAILYLFRQMKRHRAARNGG